MAEAQTPKPQWGALFVIGFVLAALGGAAFLVGPGAVNCAGTQGNFGECLKQDMVARGIISVEGAADAETQTAEAAAPVEQSTPQVAEADEPASSSADTAEAISALFFDVRVEPDGNVAVIGSGAPPNEEVRVFGNGELLGATVATGNGDFVVLPEANLPTGGIELRVETADASEAPEKSIVVIVNEDKTSEPLVIASTPGEADSVMQGAVASTKAQQQSVGPGPQLDVAEAKPEEANTEAPPAGQSMDVAAVDPKEQPSAPEATPAPSTPPVTPAPPTVAAPVTPPTIDAIEIDGNQNFIAGGGQEGAVVRLYVDDKFIADTIVEGGRWLVETDGNVLSAPSQRVRADMLETGTAAVVARAEVNFGVEPVAPAAPSTAVASAPQADEAAKNEQTEVSIEQAAPTADPNAEINAAGANNASAQLASPPQLPVTPAPADEKAPVQTALATPPANPPQSPDSAATETPADTSVPRAQIDANSAINSAAAANNTPSTLASPPQLPVNAPTPAVNTADASAPARDPNQATNAAGADNASAQLESPPQLPVNPVEQDQQKSVASAQQTAPQSPAPATPVKPEPSDTSSAETEPEMAAPSAPVEPTTAATEAPKAPEPSAPTATPAPDASQRAEEMKTASNTNQTQPQSAAPATAAPKVEPAPIQEATKEVASAPNDQMSKQLDKKTTEKMYEKAEQSSSATSQVASNTQSAAEAQTKPEAAIPTLVARQTEDGRFVSGQAIIRRGDNLWTIARRVYGQGIRYTTIYEANQTQIRDPHWIYPGQVFDLPEDAN